MIQLAAYAGPDRVPAEYFTDDIYADVFDTTEHLVR
jgi:hypothetical protein